MTCGRSVTNEAMDKLLRLFGVPVPRLGDGDSASCEQPWTGSARHACDFPTGPTAAETGSPDAVQMLASGHGIRKEITQSFQEAIKPIEWLEEDMRSIGCGKEPSRIP